MTLKIINEAEAGRSTDQALPYKMTLDFLADASQLLWREPSFEKMIQKFLSIGKERLGVTAAGLYSFSTEAKSLTPKTLELGDIPTVDEELVSAAKSSFLKLKLKSQEYRQGGQRFHHNGQDLNFTLLGDPNTEWLVLFWSTKSLSSSSTDQVEADRFLDFLVRQLQSGHKWYARMDKTQALLYRDDLTGLYNVRYLEVALDSEIRRAQRFENSFCLLFIDLDHFKPINDQHGHLAGSDVLKQLADVLRVASREVDSVIRYGGDEFIVLLLGANADTGLLAAERIRRRIEQTHFKLEQGKTARLTACIGVAAFPEHAQDKESLLKLADECMYEGKRAGKNKVVLVSNRASQRDEHEAKEL